MSKQLKLGFMIGYWGAGPPANAPELLAEAERLGYDSAWTAEAYGSDALTPLAWYGSQTTRIQLGTSIAQIGPHADRDGHGRDHDGPPHQRPVHPRARRVRPAGRRGLVRPALPEAARAHPRVRRDHPQGARARRAGELRGEHYTLPYPGGAGLGKPVKSITHPLRKELPIYLAAEGPKNVALTAEIADGWLAIYFSPRVDGFYRDALAEGFARPGAVRDAKTSRSPRRSPSSSTTTSRRPRASCGRCSRCTSVAWVRAR